MTRGKVGMEAVSIVPRPVHLNSAGQAPTARRPKRRDLLAGTPPPPARCCCPAGPGHRRQVQAALRPAAPARPAQPPPHGPAPPGLGDRAPHQPGGPPDPVELRATDPELFRHPFLLLSGDRGFAPPPDAEVVRLRRYLTYGGFLLIDSAEGRASGRFDESVRKLLARALPGDLPARVENDHVIWKSFYVLKQASGRIMAAPYIEAVERDRRLAVVYTQNDLCGALARDGFGRWENEVIPAANRSASRPSASPSTSSCTPSAWTTRPSRPTSTSSCAPGGSDERIRRFTDWRIAIGSHLPAGC
jgi:hypothetical protein